MLAPPHPLSELRLSLQGLEPCFGCIDVCYQCGERGLTAGDNAALAWDLGEIYGLGDPTRLPSPTTSSLARTVVMHPEQGTVTRLHVTDAERAQGMMPGHTRLTPEQEEKYSAKSLLKARFRCVGNAVPGVVRLSAATPYTAYSPGELRADGLGCAAGAWGALPPHCAHPGLSVPAGGVRLRGTRSVPTTRNCRYNRATVGVPQSWVLQGWRVLRRERLQRQPCERALRLTLSTKLPSPPRDLVCARPCCGAETKGQARGLAAALHAICGQSRAADADGSPEAPRAGDVQHHGC